MDETFSKDVVRGLAAKLAGFLPRGKLSRAVDTETPACLLDCKINLFLSVKVTTLFLERDYHV